MNTAVKIARVEGGCYKQTRLECRALSSENEIASLAATDGSRENFAGLVAKIEFPHEFRAFHKKEKKGGSKKEREREERKGKGKNSVRQSRITGLVFYSAPQEIMPLTWPKFPCPRTVCNLSLSLGNSHLDSWVGGGGGFSAS